MKFVLASKNQHKLKEMQQMLAVHGIELILQSELGLELDVEENGTSFEENSFIKANAVMQASGMAAIADDSGLVVDALNGAPGIYSARFGGDACATDEERYRLLLQKMQDVPNAARTARFVCVITAVFPDGRRVSARGACEGSIARKPHTGGGFGYDPVFYVPEEGCTFAQMSAERKNQISHRAKALQEFTKRITEG